MTRLRKRTILYALEGALEDTVELTRLKIQLAAVPYSKTIASTLFNTDVERRRGGMEAHIYSPYFWSRIVNEGRSGATKTGGRRFVWFRDPLRSDPRLDGDYHRTWRQARNAQRLNLSQERFRAMVKSGQLIVSRSISAVPAAHFVERGTEDVRADYRAFVTQALRDVILPRIDGPAEYRAVVRI